MAGLYSRRVRLTEAVIAALEPVRYDGSNPEANAKRARPLKVGEPVATYHFDAKDPGFAVCVSAKGKKSYVVQRRVGARNVKFKFGTVGRMTLAEARVEARRLLSEMERGSDPLARKRKEREDAEREGYTLRDALTAYMKGPVSERTRSNLKFALNKYLADWLDRPLLELTREAVRNRHERIARENGPVAADTAMRYLRTLHNDARLIHEDLPEQITRAVKWRDPRPTRRVLTQETLPEWWSETEKLRNPVLRDLHQFILLTGLRRESACSVRWEHVDLDKATVFIPNPKGGEARAFTLPLSRYLVDMLRARRKATRSDFVFPSEDSKTGYIYSPRAQRNATLTSVSIHDLRRTFITVAESLDISAYSIKLLANHQLPESDVTGLYIAADVERLRAPMQKITDRILEMTKSNVIEFKVQRPAS